VIPVRIKKLHPDAVVPAYATPGSAGCDVCALESTSDWKDGRLLVRTGISLEVPEGHECQVRPRSGLALKSGITVLNSPGTIDCFAEDSVISTDRGKLLASQLTLGSTAFSFNEDRCLIENDIVDAIVNVGERDVLVFALEDGTQISLTENTLIYTKDGLKRASEVTLDDEFLVDHNISVNVN
jgi:hypothetical protein